MPIIKMRRGSFFHPEYVGPVLCNYVYFPDHTDNRWRAIREGGKVTLSIKVGKKRKLCKFTAYKNWEYTREPGQYVYLASVELYPVDANKARSLLL